MTIKDIIDFVNSLWKSKYVYLYLVVFFIVANIPLVNNYSLHSKKSWLVVISIMAITIILLMIIINKRSFPKFKRNQYGIIFAIDIEDEREYNIINKKFVKRFQDKLSSAEKNYKVELLNSYTSNKFSFKYNTLEKKEEFLKKHNVKFIVYGDSTFGSEYEKVSCKLDLGSGITHGAMTHNNHKMLQIEMAQIFSPLKDIAIYKETEINDFELNALQLNYAFEYILASSYLFSLKTVEAYNTFSKLQKGIMLCNKNMPVINYIKHIIDDRICFCANLIASEELGKYYDDHDVKHIDNMKFYVEKLIERSYPSYSSNLIIAIYYFISQRNISEAQKYIEKCKNVTKDDNWKFSKVFLKLYQKDSLNNFLGAYKVYSQAFSRENIKYVDVNGIFEFIIIVLEQEPDKKQLYFLLFLLNYYREDDVFLHEYYNKFALSYPSIIENENMKSILIKIGIIKEYFEEEKVS